MPAAPSRVPVADLRAFAQALLAAAGVPAAHAAIVADALVAADVEDLPSHGTMLLPMYVARLRAGSVSPGARGVVLREQGGIVVLDAQDALGQVTADWAVALAVENARVHGLAAVAARNAFHFGAAGHWARQIAAAGCVGIAMANTRPLMPAPGGAQAVTGNNPIAIAVPCGEGEAVVTDVSWSAATMGKIRLAQAAGEAIPRDWASDAAGAPTTDPAAAIAGMLLPAAGPKGFAMAMMIDLLCGGLSGGAMGAAVQPLYGDPSVPYRCSLLFLAMQIDAFRPEPDFAADADAFVQAIRASRPAPGAGAVRVPGDRASWARGRNAESCPLAGPTRQALAELAASLMVAVPPALA